ncbi:MAG TPA: hydrogenase/urease maturation nickel metallochaperone HypA [Candidatus Limnocylindrales bacterium]
MHEVSLVAELVEVAEARAGGAPVALVRVRHATTIPEDVLRQAFAMLTETGPLAGAVLDLQPFDVELACACGFTGALGHDDMVGGSMAVCPACGEVNGLPPTAELELLEVRLAR